MLTYASSTRSESIAATPRMLGRGSGNARPSDGTANKELDLGRAPDLSGCRLVPASPAPLLCDMPRASASTHPCCAAETPRGQRRWLALTLTRRSVAIQGQTHLIGPASRTRSARR